MMLMMITLFYSCSTMMGTPADEELKSYEEILEYDGKGSADLYVLINEWFVDNFNSAESVIEFQDKEAGKIAGKYVFNYNEGVYVMQIKQTVSIDIRENKIRVTFKNPYYRALSGMGQSYNNAFVPLKTQAGVDRARQEWKLLVKSMDEFISGSKEW